MHTNTNKFVGTAALRTHKWLGLDRLSWLSRTKPCPLPVRRTSRNIKASYSCIQRCMLRTKKKVKRLSAWQHTVRDPVVNLPWRHKSQRLFIHLIPLFSDLKKLILFAGARHFINLMLVPAPFKGVDSNQTTTGLKSGAWTCLASWVTGQHETSLHPKRTQHVLRERNAGIIRLSSCWQLRI